VTDWNPRFVAYARAHGKSPEAMLEADRETWSGGKMAGFMLWMSERWREWRSINRRGRDDVLSNEDHASFDAFISEFAVRETQAARSAQ
jgi:hypothetical protein